MSEKSYIVWNEAKTEGFVTTDWQLAYETRKSAKSNGAVEGRVAGLPAERPSRTES